MKSSISRIEIKRLFGASDIDISFKERVTVLYGLNGSGKTVTLDILHRICSGDIKLEGIQFDTLKLTLDDGDSLTIKGDTFAVSYGGLVEERHMKDAYDFSGDGDEQGFLAPFLDKLPKALLANTDLAGIQQEVLQAFQQINQQYHTFSAELEGSMLLRLIHPYTVYSLEDLKRILRGVISEETRSKKKLGVLREYADTAVRILSVLNRVFSTKTVILSAKDGYQILTQEGWLLPLDKLSSGEQQELVLQHNLLFKAEQGSYILVDEPERSMHPSWQEAFLPNFFEVAKEKDLHLVVATHSPYIANDYPELMVGLHTSI